MRPLVKGVSEATLAGSGGMGARPFGRTGFGAGSGSPGSGSGGGSEPGSGGEVLARTWLIKLFDVTSNGTDNNELLTFSNCKLSVVDISKSVEGAVKADITVICPGEPATTTTD